MAVISITRLRLRSWRFLPAFAIYAARTGTQVRRAKGNRGMNFLREPGMIFWTATAWETEEDVRQYMISGAHGKVMPKLMTWCDEASVVRWEQDGTTLPTWQEAHRRMVSEGRRSKVRFPSEAQERFEVPAPKG
jgi:hypothetical protein